jgi:hypothetical protein
MKIEEHGIQRPGILSRFGTSSTTGTDNIHIKGTLCEKGLKWEAKGDFNDKFCKGTWEMNQ